MKPLAAFPIDARRAIRGVFCDIDDTLSTEGRITAEGYASLQQLQQAGLWVIPVTGRPAGWCDFMARMWPVDAVIGENGAFYFRYDLTTRKMIRRFVDDAATRAKYRASLAAIAADIVAAVPGAAIAADQAYRETDLAIDVCEDVPPLPQSAIDEIVIRMQQHGLTAKQSSIHVNGWFGHYDKLSMAKVLTREIFSVDLDTEHYSYIFVGDSPNDAPMFAYFPHAVGVANIQDFGVRVSHLPAYITQARCGAGFAEVVTHLLAAGQPLA
jgi:HAD superfamily hydrolase (TIGR01484 family)